MNEEIILMIVPGPRDRAFYKALITRLYGNVRDLDAKTFENEKKSILKSAIQSISEKWARTSIVKIDGNKSIILIIKPSEKSVESDTKDILNYILNREDSKIRHIIIAEDAEDKDPSIRLRGIIDSIKSLQVSQNSVSLYERYEGRTYAELLVKGPRFSVNMLIMIQGVSELNVPGISAFKHAIEDYIIYMYYDELLGSISGAQASLSDILSGGNVHKKVATLIALLHCYSSVEEFLFKVDYSRYEELTCRVECLRVFKEFIDCKLSSTL
ncbi:MAG: hypothetical protein GXO23_02345 [Crenarchaeota archaeon]|nr:hypothetical protein [Thermoproteota archaeon]